MVARPYRIQVSVRKPDLTRVIVGDELISGKMNLSLTDKVDKFEFIVNNKQGQFSTSETFKEDNEVLAFATNTNLNGCVGYYQFGDRLEDDEDDATKTYDRSGDENNGTITTASYVDAGKFGKALSFDGSNDYVTLDNETSFDFERTDPFTLMAWVKTTDTTNKLIFGKLDVGPVFRGYQLSVNSDITNDITIHMINDNTTTTRIKVRTVATTITDGSYHHVVFTYDGSGLASGCTFYFDGIKQSVVIVTDALGSNTILNDIALRIGTREDLGGKWNGDIDDARVYNRELTASEVSQMHKETFPRSELIFGGYMEKRIMQRKRRSNKNSKIRCQCIGWGINLMERLVVDQFPNQPIKDIVSELVTKYLQGLNFVLRMSGGTTSPGGISKFNYEPLIEVLKALGTIDIAGDLDIVVTADKTLKIFPRGIFKTGVSFKTGDTGNIEELQHTVDVSRFLDEAILRGAVRTLDDITNLTVDDTSKTLDLKSYGAKLAPVNPKLRGFKLAIEKVGSPTSDLTGTLVIGGVTTPSATKMLNFKIPGSAIAATLPSDDDDWPTVDFGIDELQFLDTNATYWVILHKTGDSSNTYRWLGTASGSNGADSDDEISWNAITFTFGYKSLTQAQVIVIAQNPLTVGNAFSGGRYRQDLFANPVVISPEVLRHEGERLIERFNTRFEEVKITAKPPDGTWVLPGDQIEVVDSDANINADDFVVHEVSWDFRPAFRTWTYELVAARSEEVESLEDLLAQHQRNLWEEKRARLGISEDFEIDYPFSFRNNLTIESIADFPTRQNDGNWLAVDNAARDGTLNGGMGFVDGKFGKAIKFDGTDDYVSVPFATGLDFERTNSFSIFLWVKNTDTNLSIIAEKHTNDAAKRGYNIVNINDGDIRITIQNDQATTNRIRVETNNQNTTDGNYHHIGFTYDGSSTAAGVKIYIDNKEITDRTVVNDALSATIKANTPFELGRRQAGTFHYTGDEDEVLIYPKVLSTSEIDDLAHGHLVPGAALYFDMEEGIKQPVPSKVQNVASLLATIAAG